MVEGWYPLGVSQRSIRESARPRESAPPIDPFESPDLLGPLATSERPEPGRSLRDPEVATGLLLPDPQLSSGLTPAQWLRRVPPWVYFLGVAAIASLGFLLAQLLSRTASVPLLTSAAVVAGLVWVVVAAAASAGTLRMRQEDRFLPSLLFALLAGFAAIGSAVAFAGALVLFMALGF